MFLYIIFLSLFDLSSVCYSAFRLFLFDIFHLPAADVSRRVFLIMFLIPHSFFLLPTLSVPSFVLLSLRGKASRDLSSFSAPNDVPWLPQTCLESV
jgi:hypothetical protein